MIVLRCIWVFLVLSFVVRLKCQDTKPEKGQDPKPEKGQDDVEEDGKKDDDDKLTEEQLRQAHATIDENGDKEASKEELLSFVEKHETEAALAEIDVDEELKRKDTSSDGKITLEEHLSDTLKGYELAVKDNKNVDPKIAEEAQKSLDTARQDEIELFNAADANNDGVLDKSELPALMSPGTNGKVLDVVVKTSIRDADTDKNGKLSLEEFRESGLGDSDSDEDEAEATTKGDNADAKDGKEDKEEEEEEDKDVKQLFSRLDTDKDGYIDSQELRVLESGRIHQEDIVNNFVRDMDKDGDKHIDSDEMVTMRGAVQDSDLQEYLIAWARKRPVVGGR
mmetsp:Transcript_89616/g.141464  ORF Transcript_89616/g.141464 Transcript_89616/m.141464 type:complete len:337 (+) Transcript_89616:69-1079(+)